LVGEVLQGNKLISKVLGSGNQIKSEDEKSTHEKKKTDLINFHTQIGPGFEGQNRARKQGDFRNNFGLT
jgi:hypothetical protein